MVTNTPPSTATYAAALQRGTSTENQKPSSEPIKHLSDMSSPQKSKPPPTGPRYPNNGPGGINRGVGMIRGRGGNYSPFARRNYFHHQFRATPHHRMSATSSILSPKAAPTGTRGNFVSDLKQSFTNLVPAKPAKGLLNSIRVKLPSSTPSPPYENDEESTTTGSTSTPEDTSKESSLDSQSNSTSQPVPTPSVNSPESEQQSPSEHSTSQAQHRSLTLTQAQINIPTSLPTSKPITPALPRSLPPPPGICAPRRQNSESFSTGQIYRGSLQRHQQQQLLQQLHVDQQLQYGQPLQQRMMMLQIHLNQMQQQQSMLQSRPALSAPGYSIPPHLQPPPGFGSIPLGPGPITPTVNPPPGFGCFPNNNLAHNTHFHHSYPKPAVTTVQTEPRNAATPSIVHPYTFSVDNQMILWAIIDKSSRYMSILRMLIPPVEELASVGYVTRVSKTQPEFAKTPTVEERKCQHEKLLTPHKVIALDCEMAESVTGEDELIKLTAIDYFTAEVLIDKLVDPSPVEIVDWRTGYSGVTKENMVNAVHTGTAIVGGWKAARAMLWKFITPDTILVMHGGKGDMNALKMIHTNVVDSYISEFKMRRAFLEEMQDRIEGATSGTESVSSNGSNPRKRDYPTTGGYSGLGFDGCDNSSQEVVLTRESWGLALKKLLKMRFNIDIQKGEGGSKGHDSYEDAMAARELVNLHVAFHCPDLNLRFDHLPKAPHDQEGGLEPVLPLRPL